MINIQGHVVEVNRNPKVLDDFPTYTHTNIQYVGITVIGLFHKCNYRSIYTNVQYRYKTLRLVYEIRTITIECVGLYHISVKSRA